MACNTRHDPRPARDLAVVVGKVASVQGHHERAADPFEPMLGEMLLAGLRENA